jgi:pimeloyl-ACP methyl ester carboxylesterase
MSKTDRDNYPDTMTAPERAALKAVASIIDRFPGFVCLSDFDQAVIYHQLGLSPEQIAYIGDLFKLGGVRDHVDLGDGVLAPPEHCPISWRPTVLTPVFWGRQIFEPDACLPALTRVYYPSIDGAVQNAPMLELCGQFPLILFLHGHCAQEDNHVYRWERTLAQLARSGFVVAAPHLPIAAGPQQQQAFDMALGVLRWMRKHWSGRSVLLPSPATGVCGHSYGAMIASRVAVSQPVAAFASMSAGWHEWLTYGPMPVPLFELTVPSVHMWGTEGLFSDAISDEDFGAIAPPRHKIVLEGGEHWLYLQGQTGGCAPSVGGCHLLGAVAADLLAGFFARYLPPSERAEAGAAIPRSLVPPEIDLTFEQEFFAGAHLMGLKGLRFSEEGCSILSAWVTDAGSGETTLKGH